MNFNSGLEFFKSIGYSSSLTLENSKTKQFLSDELKGLNTVVQNYEIIVKINYLYLFNNELLEVDESDKYNILSFVEVKLTGEHQTKTGLSSITREINKKFTHPVIVYFDYGELVTLAFTDRRVNKKDENKDVLTKVTLIKDINKTKTHPAHQRSIESIARENIRASTVEELYEEIKANLDISLLNKEFYNRLHREVFTPLKEKIEYPNSDENEKVNFIVRLIGRVLFVKFLEKKSLVPEQKFKIQKEYYHTVLEPLFFETLNKEISSREKENREDEIPYLNGGLFSPSGGDCYHKLNKNDMYLNTLKVPDDVLENFLNLLNEYHFTLDENTSSEADVGLDPELLGNVFEELLSELSDDGVSINKKNSGSYYTPKVVVEYMCNSTLLEYLKQKTDIKEESLKDLVFNLKIDDVEPLTVLTALKDIKIIDPAVGSGAFPVGMLNRIVAMLDALDINGKEWLGVQSKEFKAKHKDRHPNYVRKLSIISNNIYGVDIQPIAIEICKLRFFLSLIVDEKVELTKENLGIEPLPNLEFKFACANSLIPLEIEDFIITKKDNSSLDIKDIIDFSGDFVVLKKDIKEYLITSDKDEKLKLIQEIKDKLENLKTNIETNYQKKVMQLSAYEKTDKPEKIEIDNLKNEVEKLKNINNLLSTYKPFENSNSANFFNSEIMFANSEKFDIVIGNPPYGKLQNYDLDIYLLFMLFARTILNESGVNSFILPLSWISSETKSFKEFRKKFLKNNFLNELSFLPFDIFSDAYVDTCIYLGKSSSNDGYIVKRFSDKNFKNFEITKIESSNFSNGEIVRFNNLASKFYNYENGFYLNNKINKEISAGKGIIVSHYKFENKKQKDYIAYKEGDIYRYFSNIETIAYVESNSISNEVFKVNKEKILVRMIVNRQNRIMAMTSKGIFTVKQNIYTFLNDNNNISNLYILSIINSSLISYMILNSNPLASKDDFRQIRMEDIKQLPIPKITIEEQQPFIDLVERIIADKEEGKDTTKLEKQIDQMVYKLYGLTDDEVVVVEGS